jgi:hypothetical protein
MILLYAPKQILLNNTSIKTDLANVLKTSKNLSSECCSSTIYTIYYKTKKGFKDLFKS